MTNENGDYSFDDIEVALIQKKYDAYTGIDFSNYQYYVEFEYDGLKYEPVTPYNQISQEVLDRVANVAQQEGRTTNKEQWKKDVIANHSSRATEISTYRDVLNAKFAKVEAYNNNTVQAKDADGNQTSLITYSLDRNTASATVINATNMNITANTQIVYPKFEYNEMQAQTEITGINLGLKERVQIDVALGQDVQQVDVGIKGEHHVYKYGSLIGEMENPNSDIWDNVGIAFRDKYGNNPYLQPIYRADFAYKNDDDTSKELKMTLTYKITLKNQTGITTEINSIADYFDSRYISYKVRTDLENDKSIIMEEDSRITGKGIGQKASDSYRRINIPLNITLEGSTTKSIYIQFEFDKRNVLNSLNEPGEVPGYQNVKNVAEITSYTAFKDNKLYASVDKDAVLDNLTLGDVSTYEDDTRDAPDVGLMLNNPREITGYVFEDKNIQQMLDDYNIRQGNGAYDNNESLISGVKVELMEVTPNPSDPNHPTYTEKTSYTTGEDGKYSLSGFTPGTYIVRFNWGQNENTTIQNTEQTKVIPVDYKATIYDKDRYDKESSNSYFYKDINEETKNLTRALDDWSTRTRIDEKLNSNENEGKYNFETNSNDDYNIDKIKEISMQSNTPKMKFNIEYDDKDISNTNLNITENGQKIATFQIPGINLGIIERPRQNLSIDKRVENVKVMYSSGETIVNADVKEDGTLDGEKDYTTYIGSSTNRRAALIKIEMDEEVLQNTGMEAIYEYTIKNGSERDYNTPDFYNHGIIKDTDIPTTITPTKIMDYLGKESIFKVGGTESDKWIPKTIGDLTGEKLVANEVIDEIKDTAMYLRTNDSPLAPRTNTNPAGTLKYEMEVEKRLSASQEDEEKVKNQVEIIEIKKLYGRRITTIPGNYKPTGKIVEESHEIDDSMAEQILIISSQGENRNYITKIAIILVVLLGIAVEILYIKKKNKK